MLVFILCQLLSFLVLPPHTHSPPTRPHVTRCDGGSEEGNCWEYDTMDLRIRLMLLGLGSKVISTTFFFLSWRAYKKQENQ